MGKDSRRIVRVTLHSGLELEIHDNEIAQAFQELDERSRAFQTLATSLHSAVLQSLPVLEHAQQNGDARKQPPDPRPALDAVRDILDKLKDETYG